MGWDFFIFIFSILAIMVTDTAFRKSSLRKLFLEKIVPGTSKNWPYHTNLLVFCLRFKLSLVCEYLNYYCNITNNYWAIPGKIQTRKIEVILVLKKTLDILSLPLYPWIFWTKKAFFTLGNSVKLCYSPSKFEGQKPRLTKIQHEFFLITSKNSTFTNSGNYGQNKALLLEIL